MTITARCKLLDGSSREVTLDDLGSSWTPTTVYDVCESALGCRVSNVENLEDIMSEVQFISECSGREEEEI